MCAHERKVTAQQTAGRDVKCCGHLCCGNAMKHQLQVQEGFLLETQQKHKTRQHTHLSLSSASSMASGCVPQMATLPLPLAVGMGFSSSACCRAVLILRGVWPPNYTTQQERRGEENQQITWGHIPHLSATHTITHDAQHITRCTSHVHTSHAHGTFSLLLILNVVC